MAAILVCLRAMRRTSVSSRRCGRTPDGVINDWVMVVGKSRNFGCGRTYYRLRAAGLAKSDEGKWALTEDPPPREPPAKWIAPVSASSGRAHAHA